MHRHRRFISPHRRARLAAWALATLLWMASLWFSGETSARHARQRGRVSLERLAVMVKQLIIARAVDFAPTRARKSQSFHRRGRNLTPRGLTRAVLGARVRRALARPRRDTFGRILALTAALRRIDRHAAIVARRMRRGLRRLWAKRPTPQSAPARPPQVDAPAFFSDTS